MNAICSTRNGRIYPRINKNFCFSWGYGLRADMTHNLHGASSQLNKLARRKIPLAYLNRVDTCVGSGGNPIQQQSQTLIALGGKLSAIGYVVEKQFLDINRTGAPTTQRRDVSASSHELSAQRRVSAVFNVDPAALGRVFA